MFHASDLVEVVAPAPSPVAGHRGVQGTGTQLCEILETWHGFREKPFDRFSSAHSMSMRAKGGHRAAF